MEAMSRERAAEFVALDEALGKLTGIDERKSRIVELRFFGGLTVEEVADVLKLSPITIKREWRSARAWLQRELSNNTSLFDVRLDTFQLDSALIQEKT